MITLRQAFNILKKSIFRNKEAFVEETTVEDFLKKYLRKQGRKLRYIEVHYNSSPAMLAHELLTLPKDTSIVSLERDIMRQSYLLYVADDSFSVVKEGCVIPKLDTKINGNTHEALLATAKLLGIRND